MAEKNEHLSLLNPSIMHQGHNGLTVSFIRKWSPSNIGHVGWPLLAYGTYFSASTKFVSYTSNGRRRVRAAKYHMCHFTHVSNAVSITSSFSSSASYLPPSCLETLSPPRLCRYWLHHQYYWATAAFVVAFVAATWLQCRAECVDRPVLW